MKTKTRILLVAGLSLSMTLPLLTYSLKAQTRGDGDKKSKNTLVLQIQDMKQTPDELILVINKTSHVYELKTTEPETREMKPEKEYNAVPYKEFKKLVEEKVEEEEIPMESWMFNLADVSNTAEEITETESWMLSITDWYQASE